MLGGLALAVSAELAAIAATSIGTLIVARVIQAIGAATGVVMGRAIIRDLYERDRAAGMIGLVTTAMVMVPMIAPLIGGLLDTGFGWESIFLFTAAFAAIVWAWALLVLQETRPADAARGGFDPLAAMAPPARQREIPTAMCWPARSARRTFFAFLGGGPHVVITLMGRTSAEYGVWFADLLDRLHERQLHRLAAVAALRRR